MADDEFRDIAVNNGDDIQLGRIEHLDPRTIWESEPARFTPWLATHLPLLGEALGLDLEHIETESRSGDFLCDIFARETGSNRPVVIENQLEKTDHDHLGKLLTYAASKDAAVVIWISPNIRDDHKGAVDWLNRHTNENIDFFAVQLETIRIGGSLPAPNFRPVAFPTTWSRTRPASSRPSPSDRQEQYRAFFQPAIDELREKFQFTSARIAQPQSWFAFASGITGIKYSASFDKDGRLRAELYIDVGDTPHNKAIFDAFYRDKEALDKEYGEPLIWQRLDHRQASRIMTARSNSSIEQAQSLGPIMREWLIERLIVLKRVFGQRLHEIYKKTKPAAENADMEPNASPSI